MPRARDEKPKGKNAKRKQFKISALQQEIFDLWKAGASLRSISEQLRRRAAQRGESTRGFSHEQIRTHLDHILEANQSDFTDQVDHFRQLQVARLNDLYLRYLPMATGTIDPVTKIRSAPSVHAGKLVLGIIKEFNEMSGLKAAIKLEHSGNVGINWSEIAARAKDDRNMTDEV